MKTPEHRKPAKLPRDAGARPPAAPARVLPSDPDPEAAPERKAPARKTPAGK